MSYEVRVWSEDGTLLGVAEATNNVRNTFMN